MCETCVKSLRPYEINRKKDLIYINTLAKIYGKKKVKNTKNIIYEVILSVFEIKCERFEN